MALGKAAALSEACCIFHLGLDKHPTDMWFYGEKQ